MEDREFKGHDPFDALNSPLCAAAGRTGRWIRIACTQALKRLPVNPRDLLLIKPSHNPKGIGLFLGGYSRLESIERSGSHTPTIHRLIDILEETRSTNCTGSGWGYDFPWQSRAFYLPRLTPTIVNTAFIGHALLDTHEQHGIERARELALPAADFILTDLNRHRDGDAFCFSYTPLDHYVVHNANLLGASLLIRIHQITGDPATRDAALASLAYSMKHQHKDGSWFYAERSGSNWIDSFHTGFNLQAIRTFLACGEAEEYLRAYERGVNYYAAHFFLNDGTPKYFANRTYPLDIHSPAQAIAFFCGEPLHRDLTERILHWMLDNMLDPRGFFYFRKGRYLTNRIPYMRWAQAWVFHALAMYLHEADG